MSNKQTKTRTKGWLNQTWAYLWQHGLWNKIVFIVLAIMIFCSGVMYGVGQWYINNHSKEPLVLGTTFIPDYAKSFGLDPKETFKADLAELGVKQVRLVSYWNTIEPNQGTYDFSELDWEFAMANQYGAKVSLAVGLRQPRWPECHEPSWVDMTNKNQWKPALYKYMRAVVERYKNNPALNSYQLENEFFMTVFGECKNFDRSRLVEEFNMVKKADPKHKIIISRSNNWVGIPVGDPKADEYGISVYKRVWDSTFTHRYFEYPLPAHFYAFLAGAEQIYSGRNMVIHELQAEPWPPNGQLIVDTPIKEQYKSMNPQRMKSRIEYGKSTGIKSIDIWGTEWAYYLKTKKDQPEVWNVIKDEISKANAHNQKIAQN